MIIECELFRGSEFVCPGSKCIRNKAYNNQTALQEIIIKIQYVYKLTSVCKHKYEKTTVNARRSFCWSIQNFSSLLLMITNFLGDHSSLAI